MHLKKWIEQSLIDASARSAMVQNYFWFALAPHPTRDFIVAQRKINYLF